MDKEEPSVSDKDEKLRYLTFLPIQKPLGKIRTKPVSKYDFSENYKWFYKSFDTTHCEAIYEIEYIPHLRHRYFAILSSYNGLPVLRLFNPPWRNKPSQKTTLPSKYIHFLGRFCSLIGNMPKEFVDSIVDEDVRFLAGLIKFHDQAQYSVFL